jgi:anaerobic magnesium-protoporphyrin IX monomethyl ester cyclase
MVGRAILLINPPLVGGIAFTRQGRCQERQETLGTTKPPYSLALLAALLRERGRAFRLIDQTGERIGTDTVIERLDREGFEPTLIVFCSTVPTLDADVVEMTKLKRRFNAPLVCFGPHAACAPVESMERAPDVDAMIVGEPEDAVLALVDLDSFEHADRVPSLILRREGALVRHRDRGSFAGFLDMPFPAWDLLPLDGYRLPLVTKPYLLVETSRGCPYACDFCVVPFFHGHKFRERGAKQLVDDIERGHRELGIEYFYLWGDTVTLNAKSFSDFCEELIARRLDVKWFANARADNLQDPAFVERLRRAGCWMLSMGVESGSDDTRRDMMKRLEHAKIGVAFRNLRRAGIKSFGFFIYGYPGDTVESMTKTTDYAIELDADFANFYPAVPYPGTPMFEKCKRDGLLTTDDWTRMEYSYYILRGNGLDEHAVMQALNRARRRFFLRPSYLVRHLGEILRIVATDQRLVFELAWRMLFGKATTAPPPAGRTAVAPDGSGR